MISIMLSARSASRAPQIGHQPRAEIAELGGLLAHLAAQVGGDVGDALGHALHLAGDDREALARLAGARRSISALLDRSFVISATDWISSTYCRVARSDRALDNFRIGSGMEFPLAGSHRLDC